MACRRFVDSHNLAAHSSAHAQGAECLGVGVVVVATVPVGTTGSVPEMWEWRPSQNLLVGARSAGRRSQF